MAILNFQKPDKIALQKTTDFEAQFEFRPLEPGYGVTIGNALRRVLLSSLEGYAITAIRIPGADHEFATLKGVLEDVTEIILNLKQVRFKAVSEYNDFTSEKVDMNVKGSEVFTAGMIGEALPNFQVMNPDLVICNLQPGASFQIESTLVRAVVMCPLRKIVRWTLLSVSSLSILSTLRSRTLSTISRIPALNSALTSKSW